MKKAHIVTHTHWDREWRYPICDSASKPDNVTAIINNSGSSLE